MTAFNTLYIHIPYGSINGSYMRFKSRLKVYALYGVLSVYTASSSVIGTDIPTDYVTAVMCALCALYGCALYGVGYVGGWADPGRRTGGRVHGRM